MVSMASRTRLDRGTRNRWVDLQVRFSSVRPHSSGAVLLSRAAVLLTMGNVAA